MKNITPLAVLLLTMITDYLRLSIPSAPSAILYLPDLTLAIISISLIARLIWQRSWATIPIRYWVLFLGFVYVCIAGLVMNNVSGDTAFAGFRLYFRFLPLFLLPLVYVYESKDISFQLKVLSGFLILQIPITLYQRFVESAGVITGDGVVGTLGSSSSLALIASFAIAATAAHYLDKRISFSTALILGALFLIPAGLAETKITPVLILASCGMVVLMRIREIAPKTLLALAVSGVAVLSNASKVSPSLIGLCSTRL